MRALMVTLDRRRKHGNNKRKWIIFPFLFSLSSLGKKLGSMVVGDCSHHCTYTAHQHCANSAQQHCANTAYQHWFPQKWHQMIDTLLEDLWWDYFIWHIAVRSFIDHVAATIGATSFALSLINLLHASFRATRRISLWLFQTTVFTGSYNP